MPSEDTIVDVADDLDNTIARLPINDKNALNASLELSNHLREMGFKVTIEEAGILLFAYINAAISVVPFESSSSKASDLANVPGTRYMPTEIRKPVYVGASTGINGVLNGDTANSGSHRLIRHYLGNPDFKGAIQAFYKALTKDNRPVWKKAVEEVARLISIAWSVYSAVSFVQMGRDSGMKDYYVPFTFAAFGFLHLGGLDWFLLDLIPNALKSSYRHTLMRIPCVPKLHEPTAHDIALSILRQQRLAALSTASRNITRMLNAPQPGDQEKIAELMDLLKQVGRDDAEQKRITAKLLAKITQLGKDPAGRSRRENIAAKTLQGASSISSVGGLFGYMVATVKGVGGRGRNAIEEAVVSFLPFMAFVLKAGLGIAAMYAHCIMHPIDSWQHRDIYMRHFAIIVLPLLAFAMIAAYISTGPLLFLNQDGLNYIFEQHNLCAYDITNVTSSTENSRTDCTANPELWSGLYNIFTPLSIIITMFFNPAGLPGALKNTFRLITAASCCNDQQKDEYRLLEFVQRVIDQEGSMNDGAWLRAMHDITGCHKSAGADSATDLDISGSDSDNSDTASSSTSTSFSEATDSGLSFASGLNASAAGPTASNGNVDINAFLAEYFFATALSGLQIPGGVDSSDFVPLINALFAHFSRNRHRDFAPLQDDLSELPTSVADIKQSPGLFRRCVRSMCCADTSAASDALLDGRKSRRYG